MSPVDIPDIISCALQKHHRGEKYEKKVDVTQLNNRKSSIRIEGEEICVPAYRPYRLDYILNHPYLLIKEKNEKRWSLTGKCEKHHRIRG